MYKMIVDNTQFAKLVDAKDIFLLNYTDSKQISTNNYGSIAIAKGLSIIDSKEKTFSPNEYVKMEEFAHALYNSIKYMVVTNY